MLVQRCEIVYNAPRCASSQQICPPRSFGKAAAARVKLHRVQAADFGAPGPGADNRLIELVDAGFEDSFDTATIFLDQGLNVDQINKLRVGYSSGLCEQCLWGGSLEEWVEAFGDPQKLRRDHPARAATAVHIKATQLMVHANHQALIRMSTKHARVLCRCKYPHAYGIAGGVLADIVAVGRNYKPGPLEVIKIPDPFAYPGPGDQKQMVIGTYLEKKVLESCGSVAAVEQYLLELFEITAQNRAACVVYDSRATGRAMMFPVKSAPDLKGMLDEAKFFMVHDPSDQQ